jgi:hypothetical protein
MNAGESMQAVCYSVISGDNLYKIMKRKITLLEFKLEYGLSKLVKIKNTWLAKEASKSLGDSKSKKHRSMNR